NPVDGLVACRRDEPGAGIRRDAVSGPPFCGDRERLLGGFFGAVEIAEEAGEGRNDTSPLIAEDLPGQCSTRGRTSTAPCRAPGMRAAKEIASSRRSPSPPAFREHGTVRSRSDPWWSTDRGDLPR